MYDTYLIADRRGQGAAERDPPSSGSSAKQKPGSRRPQAQTVAGKSPRAQGQAKAQRPQQLSLSESPQQQPAAQPPSSQALQAQPSKVSSNGANSNGANSNGASSNGAQSSGRLQADGKHTSPEKVVAVPDKASAQSITMPSTAAAQAAANASAPQLQAAVTMDQSILTRESRAACTHNPHDLHSISVIGLLSNFQLQNGAYTMSKHHIVRN